MTTEPEPPAILEPPATPEPASSPEPGSTAAPVAPDAGDDYGYDLAHEVKDALRIPVARPRRSATPARGGGRPPEQDGDLGYDDAHEVRGS